MKKQLYLVDLSNIVFRAYYALPPMASRKGVPTSAIYGTFNTLFKFIKDKKPEALIVAGDLPDPCFRKEYYPEYKANRKECPQDLSVQFVYIKEMLARLGLRLVEIKGYEADDIIATLIHKFKDRYNCTILSSDKDLMQLVDDGVNVLDLKNNLLFDENEVRKKYGVSPDRIIDLLSIQGDSSDNIPGVKGVGAKGAVKLLQEYNNVEGIYQNLDKIKGKLQEKLIDSRENAFLSKKLVSLEEHVPLNIEEVDLEFNRVANEKILIDCQELDLNQLERQIKAIYRLTSDQHQVISGKHRLTTDDKPLAPDQGSLTSDDITLTTDSTLASNEPKIGSGSTSSEEISDSSFTQLSGENAEAISSSRDESQNVKIIKYKKIWLQKTSQLDDLVVAIRSAKQIAVKMVGQKGKSVESHCLEGICIGLGRSKSYFIPVLGRNEFGNISLNHIKEKINPILLDETITKVVFDLKSDLKFLFKEGFAHPVEVIDIMIMMHLIDPDRKEIDLKTIGKNEFNIQVVATNGEEDLFSGSNFPSELTILSINLYKSLVQKLKKMRLNDVFKNLETSLIHVLFEMEKEGVYVDVNCLTEYSTSLQKEKVSLQEEIFELAGEEFNINSPKQLSTILFEKLKLEPPKKTKTGYSTDIDVLTQLAKVHKLPLKLIRFRTIDKIKGTYLDPLVNHVCEKTNRIHANFNQVGTATGRLSSNSPNLQNIPIRTKEGVQVRECFRPRSGFELLSADYSQIELRILAHLSKDKTLIEAFLHDKDIHNETASKIFNVKQSEVTAEMRRKAKTINFGVIYGQTAFGLAGELDIPKAEASDFIKKYFNTYYGVKGYFEGLLEGSRKNGYIKTLMGRKRFIAEINSSNKLKKALAERMAINSTIQGSAADLIKIAMIKINKKLKKYRSSIIIQVHDELVLEVEKNEREAVSKIVHYEMESVYDLGVPLKVVMNCGYSWKEAHS